MRRVCPRRCALVAALLPLAAGQQQFAGDGLQLWWCDAADATQHFTLSPDATLRTPTGLCVENVANATVALGGCGTPPPVAQLWSFVNSTFVSGAAPMCFNLQSDASFMSANSSVKLWPCDPPAWNDFFTLNAPSPGLILANSTSPGNTSDTDLCVQTLHVVPPLPTPAQLAWQEAPVGCFVHYQMATMIGTQGCGDKGAPPPLSAWQPTALDTDSWVDVCASMGGTRAVYVAKHGCGFIGWRSNVSGYGYGVRQSPYPDVDVVDSFVQSARKVGMGFGFYYSVVSNAYTNTAGGKVQGGPIDPTLQINVTQEEYDLLVVAHLEELWGRYAGELTEVWFDGGYQPQLTPALQALFQQVQPQVVAFQAEGLTANPVRWVGAESGLAPYPCWSACDYSGYGAGDPNAPTWFPAETDFTLQQGDNWFYSPTSGVRPPAQLRLMYETSVGSNTALIIDIAPFPNGTVPEEQVVAARLLGAYTSSCYAGSGVVGSIPAWNGTVGTLVLTAPTPIDRVEVSEDQTGGQRVRAFTLNATLGDGSTVLLGPPGSSIGNKRIVVLPSPVTVHSVTLTISSTDQGLVPVMKGLRVLSCGALAAEGDAAWEAWVAETGYAPVVQEEGGEGGEGRYVRPWLLPRAE